MLISWLRKSRSQSPDREVMEPRPAAGSSRGSLPAVPSPLARASTSASLSATSTVLGETSDRAAEQERLLEELWAAICEGDGNLTRTRYFAFHAGLYRALRLDWDSNQAFRRAVQDWNHDSGGVGFVPRDRFRSMMKVLIDRWTEGDTSPDSANQFLRGLVSGITHPSRRPDGTLVRRVGSWHAITIGCAIPPSKMGVILAMTPPRPPASDAVGPGKGRYETRPRSSTYPNDESPEESEEEAGSNSADEGPGARGRARSQTVSGWEVEGGITIRKLALMNRAKQYVSGPLSFRGVPRVTSPVLLPQKPASCPDFSTPAPPAVAPASAPAPAPAPLEGEASVAVAARLLGRRLPTVSDLGALALGSEREPPAPPKPLPTTLLGAVRSVAVSCR
eukprot:tig00000733_g3778.t1